MFLFYRSNNGGGRQLINGGRSISNGGRPFSLVLPQRSFGTRIQRRPSFAGSFTNLSGN